MTLLPESDESGPAFLICGVFMRYSLWLGVDEVADDEVVDDDRGCR